MSTRREDIVSQYAARIEAEMNAHPDRYGMKHTPPDTAQDRPFAQQARHTATIMLHKALANGPQSICLSNNLKHVLRNNRHKPTYAGLQELITEIKHEEEIPQ